MGHARGAAAVRLAKMEPEPEVAVAQVIILHLHSWRHHTFRQIATVPHETSFPTGKATSETSFGIHPTVLLHPLPPPWPSLNIVQLRPCGAW